MLCLVRVNRLAQLAQLILGSLQQHRLGLTCSGKERRGGGSSACLGKRASGCLLALSERLAHTREFGFERLHTRVTVMEPFNHILGGGRPAPLSALTGEGMQLVVQICLLARVALSRLGMRRTRARLRLARSGGLGARLFGLAACSGELALERTPLAR
eukprot:scaffold294562_cov23-Tisochrysis_lutea.AAC.2